MTEDTSGSTQHFTIVWDASEIETIPTKAMLELYGSEEAYWRATTPWYWRLWRRRSHHKKVP